jgi:CRISPR-associated endonuclease/helicase Cas3
MTVDREDFAKFFAAVNGGHTPFAWQERLLDTVLRDGRWPARIAAPTGAGKTSAIDVHVFATAFTVANGGPRLPRRLAMVVDRRVLVDDQYRRALALKKALESPDHDVVSEVTRLLTKLSTVDGVVGGDTPPPPLVTARLRGGSVPSRSWRDYPTACAVLCATPDMWGSRLLFGGYGSRDEAKPRESGLLAFDTVVMIDEAHLARQLVVTARRVSELAVIAERPLNEVPALQVVEVSATPTEDARTGIPPTTVGVDDGDLAEKHLADRLTRPKPMTLLPVAEWPAQGRQVGKVAATVAKAVTAMRTEIRTTEDTVRTIGCYVNTVPMALAVADALRRESLQVVTVCGQVRPADLARLDTYYPGLLTTRGNGNVDVLVTTQSLEVGADLDLAGIVSELASGSALTQRAGRANRRGKRPDAPVTVVVPPERLAEKARSGPYPAAELNEALDWVSELAESPLGLAPWAIRESPPPPAHVQRRLYQRPELGDAWHWARTSDNLAADPELDLWLSDSFQEDTSIGLAVRDALPSVPADAIQFVRDLPPVPREIFPVPYRTAKAVLDELLQSGRLMVKVRGEDISTLQARPGGGPEVRPGDTVVVDSSAPIFASTSDGSFSPPVVAPPSAVDAAEGVDEQYRGRADDVIHYQPEPRRGSVVLRIEWSPDHEHIAGFRQDTARSILDAVLESIEDQDQSERVRRDSLAQLLKDMPEDEFPRELRLARREAISLLEGRLNDCNVIVRAGIPGTGDEEGARIVVLDGRRSVADEDLRQVLALRDAPVLLRAHQDDVAVRAQSLATAVGLPADLIEALRVAGDHHDDGKQDRRFQEFTLGHPGEGEPWAKSKPGKSRNELRRQQAAGSLPGNWRHEQRSVVDALDAVRAVWSIDQELALRLIGTSHGRGRSGFPHSAAELAGPQDSAGWRELAADLFDAGGWDGLVEATHIRYGAWGCAFLEAVLRAGDCQVSGEGK